MFSGNRYQHEALDKPSAAESSTEHPWTKLESKLELSEVLCSAHSEPKATLGSEPPLQAYRPVAGLTPDSSYSDHQNVVTVSSTGALFMEAPPATEKAPWRPNSFDEAVNFRNACMEKHRQTIEVYCDAQAQGNVSDSHLEKLRNAVFAADQKVFAAMDFCREFRQ